MFTAAAWASILWTLRTRTRLRLGNFGSVSAHSEFCSEEVSGVRLEAQVTRFNRTSALSRPSLGESWPSPTCCVSLLWASSCAWLLLLPGSQSKGCRFGSGAAVASRVHPRTQDTFLFRQFVLGLRSSQQPLVSIAGTASRLTSWLQAELLSDCARMVDARGWMVYRHLRLSGDCPWSHRYRQAPAEHTVWPKAVFPWSL